MDMILPLAIKKVMTAESRFSSTTKAEKKSGRTIFHIISIQSNNISRDVPAILQASSRNSAVATIPNII
ncbi:hypothetical protein ACTQWG_15355 [Blautia sp. HCP3S3_H10_1]|uniref:hypothetical protein n=1 Tax=unclassified Blautia TaxID=2648079 RepID=UPI003F8DED67